ncbi:hypothetical protein BH24PSE2_BH24PSE2_03040 [soil metagenome]
MSGDPRAIVRAEREHGLFDVRVLGVSLWRLIRVPVVESVLIREQSRDRFNQNRVAVDRVPHILASVARSLWHLTRLRRRRYLVLGFPRRRFEDGVWVDPFSDPLIESLEPDRVLCIEKPFVGEHRRPPRTSNLVYVDWLMAKSMLLSAIAFPVPLVLCRRRIGELARRIEHATGTPARTTRRLAAQAIVQFWVERVAARALLAAVQPRAVLLTIRRQHYAVIQACRLRGIPVFELQHGAIGEGGYKYTTPFDAAMDPDAFLSFGRFWNDLEWGLPDRRVHAIGFKYIVDRKARLGSRLGRGRKVMLVSQPHVSRRLGRQFGAIVDAHPGEQFILKLHPQDVAQWADRYPLAERPNVAVHGEGPPDLYDLFADCSSVIGYDSTVLFEASFFGLKVGVLNLDGTNPCAALGFKGRYNFREIRNLRQVTDLLRGAPDEPEPDNPFFAAFDEARFLHLLDSSARVSASAASDGDGC